MGFPHAKRGSLSVVLIATTMEISSAMTYLAAVCPGQPTILLGLQMIMGSIFRIGTTTLWIIAVEEDTVNPSMKMSPEIPLRMSEKS